MTEATQALIDRIEIDDLLIRYATAIDARDWELLDTVFTPDAQLDYRSAGGIRGPYPAVRDWLASVLPIFTWTQHLILNRSLTLGEGGDRAEAHSAFLNPNGLLVRGRPWRFTVGGAYHDQVVRTDAGWRLGSRVEETLWWDNPMPGLPPEPYSLSGPDGSPPDGERTRHRA
jgi:hypothetical protein